VSDVDVRFAASDGWPLAGLLRRPPNDPAAPVAVLVPGSVHERDAFTTLADALGERGVASLRIDIRGRGGSRGEVPYARMAPGQRRAVALDVLAAVDQSSAVVVVAEQDTAAHAVAGIAEDPRVRAVVLLSPRGYLRSLDVPVFALVSSEDRDGLRAATDAYLAASEIGSRLEVFKGLGFGTTMFSTRQFEHPDAEPLESMIADWLASVLTVSE
jgi:hypothetical protein